MTERSKRGFAAMDHEKQRALASKGGHASHEKGTAHEFTTEEARAAGRKGGEAVSGNRQHMSEIGRKGGAASGSQRAQRRNQRGAAGEEPQAPGQQPQERPGDQAQTPSEEPQNVEG